MAHRFEQDWKAARNPDRLTVTDVMAGIPGRIPMGVALRLPVVRFSVWRHGLGAVAFAFIALALIFGLSWLAVLHGVHP